MLGASVLGWYDQKLSQVTDLVTPTLWLVGAFVVLMAYIAYRSWKKAAIAALGMAIVIAIVDNVTSLSSMVEGEIAASTGAVSSESADGRPA
ncbi:hypothetical protein [Streptomonospora salina]|uniref:Putative RND superfamily exporter protein n=1 Tax=Streptomonospora salina TaxID=104205 RepID=A0A841ECQ8_9ACTN|nr:hypothetical protein [Streptomonospora salina]MBB5998768.1 putative RND superfamily exporter protein [Streptomonospora salina]